MEEDTALSIIDPVTVNMEVSLRHTEARGLSDAVLTGADRALEVTLQTFSVRLSYHDFRMLARMMDSVPRQTRQARDSSKHPTLHPANVTSKCSSAHFFHCMYLFFTSTHT